MNTERFVPIGVDEILKATETAFLVSVEDRLVYDSELGWIDPEPAHTLDSLGITCTEGREYLHYDGVDMNTFRVPWHGDWARLRLCIEDAERRSKQ